MKQDRHRFRAAVYDRLELNLEKKSAIRSEQKLANSIGRSWKLKLVGSYVAGAGEGRRQEVAEKRVTT